MSAMTHVSPNRMRRSVMEASRTRGQVGRGDGVPLHPRGPVPQLYDRREDRVTLDEVVKFDIRG
jgi:hypothetical protein